MKYWLIGVLSTMMMFSCSKERSGDPVVLVFTKTNGFVHSSISKGVDAIKNLGKKNGFEVDITADAHDFSPESLEEYAAVIFLNTTGDVLDFEQESNFERYIQAGGGFVGVHAASDTEYGWEWYGQLVGAYFKSHPAIQEAHFQIKDHSCEACSSFKDSLWIKTDEIYNFKNINEDINIILAVDESSYQGGENGQEHPISWYHEFDGGRAFYTALGHTEESYKEEKFLAHLLSGIQYAIGKNLKLDYTNSTTPPIVDQNRFAKIQLAVGSLNEPTEMTILPNHDIIFASRRGALMRYNQEVNSLKQVGYLNVYHDSGVEGVNAEEGIMGLQKDPKFEENNWLYVYYSPKGDTWVNRLSRFKFVQDTLVMDSEQIILDVASDRKICCHTGGSLAFDANGLLYLSTGDNTTPFDEPDKKYVHNGYAPLNDLPGKSQYDARRSSANTNDLRGKIIRIRVNKDGSYTIPDGNLFSSDLANTRPEIYTMGHRNPYRISIEPKKGWVFWGDIGPDANEDQMETRGPQGYDEMNIATKPGNFGWPLFIADNKAYQDYDYSTGESTGAFDPSNPINDSKNNTGLQQLPPAMGAFMYYPYDVSSDFQGLASGGRNAMAGPTLYHDLYTGSFKMPNHYNGKTIFYDWMRGWMKAVSFDENGALLRVEPFANKIKLNNLIDMELGPDGRVYLLEYGSGWFSQNDDSALSYLIYNKGNQAPTLVDVHIDQSSGKAPLSVSFKVDATDEEGDPLRYEWDMGDGTKDKTTTGNYTHTYEENGTYQASVTVFDQNELSVQSKLYHIVVGNTRPKLNINLSQSNSSFYLPGQKITYDVIVSDMEDDKKGINPEDIKVNVDYIEGFDEAELPTGHQQVSNIDLGKIVTETNTCRTCHKENGESIGPSYRDIAKKYQNDPNQMDLIKNKIRSGSSGNWGANVMPANPIITDAELNQIQSYIESLTQEKKSGLPPKGIIVPPSDVAEKTMVITASYTDRGADQTTPLMGSQRLILPSSTLSLSAAQDIVEFEPLKYDGMDLLLMPKKGGSFSLEDIDLHGVKNIDVVVGWQSAPDVPLEFDVRINALDGKIVGSGKLTNPNEDSDRDLVSIELNQPVAQKTDKLFFVYNPSENERMGMLTFVAVAAINFR